MGSIACSRRREHAMAEVKSTRRAVFVQRVLGQALQARAPRLLMSQRRSVSHLSRGAQPQSGRTVKQVTKRTRTIEVVDSRADEEPEAPDAADEAQEEVAEAVQPVPPAAKQPVKKAAPAAAPASTPKTAAPAAKKAAAKPIAAPAAHADSEAPCMVLVRDIGSTVTAKDLILELFAPYNTPRVTVKAGGHAVIEFESVDEAEDAVRTLRDVEFRGNKLRLSVIVKEAAAPAARPAKVRKTLVHEVQAAKQALPPKPAPVAPAAKPASAPAKAVVVVEKKAVVQKPAAAAAAAAPAKADAAAPKPARPAAVKKARASDFFAGAKTEEQPADVVEPVFAVSLNSDKPPSRDTTFEVVLQ